LTYSLDLDRVLRPLDATATAAKLQPVECKRVIQADDAAGGSNRFSLSFILKTER